MSLTSAKPALAAGLFCSILTTFRRRAPSHRLNLYLGNLTSELIHLPGHTTSEIAIHIPWEKVQAKRRLIGQCGGAIRKARTRGMSKHLTSTPIDMTPEVPYYETPLALCRA